MSFTALDSTKLLALMAAGGLFAIAGLWLMFRPKTDGHSAKIELFGMKFESSSAGLLVFVIGAAFLGSPLFVQERGAAGLATTSGGAGAGTGSRADGSEPQAAPVDGAEAAEGEVRTTIAQPATVATNAPRALTVVGEEIEPNDNIAEANAIPVGSVIHGEVEADNPDFYTFSFPDDFVGRLTVNLSSSASFTIYDDLGGTIPSPARKFTSEVKRTRYYVSVGTRERRADYTLTVAAREE
jgi:hypothetical protein